MTAAKQFIQTKEHQDIMEAFERAEKITPAYREADRKYWQIGAVYKDGRLNERFKAFRAGVSFGKTYFRED